MAPLSAPLAGVRAPQRVSAPSSSGLAATPLWPEPGEQRPGSMFFSLCAGLYDSEVSPLGLPLPLFPFFGSFGINPIRVRVTGEALFIFFPN